MIESTECNLGKLENLLRLYYYTCVSGKKRDLFMEKKNEVVKIMDLVK